MLHLVVRLSQTSIEKHALPTNRCWTSGIPLKKKYIGVNWIELELS